MFFGEFLFSIMLSLVAANMLLIYINDGWWWAAANLVSLSSRKHSTPFAVDIGAVLL